MKTDYDMIIAGAGPTGATCAKILAEKGYCVLVIEKCKLPRYKSCSGMIIAKTAGLVKEYFGVEIPDSVKCTPYDNYGMIFVNDEEMNTSLSSAVSMYGVAVLTIFF